MARTISQRWLDSLKLRCRLIVERERERNEKPPKLIHKCCFCTCCMQLKLVLLLLLSSLFSLPLFYLTILSSLFSTFPQQHTLTSFTFTVLHYMQEESCNVIFVVVVVSNNLSISVVSFLNILISYLCVEVNPLSMSSCFLFYDILKEVFFLFVFTYMCNNVIRVNFLIWEAFFLFKIKIMMTAVRFWWGFFCFSE